VSKRRNWRMAPKRPFDYFSRMETTVLRLNLRCPHCHRLGLATYDRHPCPELTAVYGRFHSESGRAPGPLIVCNECDTIQDVAA
jgi:hypothetical protein